MQHYPPWGGCDSSYCGQGYWLISGELDVVVQFLRRCAVFELHSKHRAVWMEFGQRGLIDQIELVAVSSVPGDDETASPKEGDVSDFMVRLDCALQPIALPLAQKS